MNLSAEQFADVLFSLSAPKSDKKRDQRRAARVSHRCRVPIMLGRDVQSGITTHVTVKDFSPRGICILHTSELPRGTNLVIQLERAEGTPVHILATVAYCRAEDKLLYTIGAEFTCILDTPSSAPTRETATQDMDRIRRSVLED